MKHIIYSVIFLAMSIILMTSCTKENTLQKSIAGTTWWSEQSVSRGTMHSEISFTSSSFSDVVTFPFTPSYPPSRTTGSYTYEYPNIYLTCPDYTDVAVMDSDYQSFKLGDYVFLRK